MSRIRLLLAASALALPFAAFGHGFTAVIDPVEAAIDAAELAVSPSEAAARAALAKARAAAEKEKNEKSLANEIDAVRRVSQFVDPHAAVTGMSGLTSALGSAEAVYFNAIAGADTTLDLARDAQGVKAKQQKAIDKIRTRLAAAITAHGAAATTTARLKIDKSAADLVKGYTSLDGGAAHDWLILTLTNALAAQSPDLDGDGTGDNALGSLLSNPLIAATGININAILADALAGATDQPIVELAFVQSFDKDPFVLARFTTGQDVDAMPTDNGSGTEPFVIAAGGAVAVTKLAKGAYSFRLTGESRQFAGFDLPVNAVFAVTGTASATQNDGVIGVTVPTAQVVAALEASGATVSPLILGILNSQADIDLDGDGTNDAFSAAFAFHAVSVVPTMLETK